MDRAGLGRSTRLSWSRTNTVPDPPPDMYLVRAAGWHLVALAPPHGQGGPWVAAEEHRSLGTALEAGSGKERATPLSPCRLPASPRKGGAMPAFPCSWSP